MRKHPGALLADGARSYRCCPRNQPTPMANFIGRKGKKLSRLQRQGPGATAVIGVRAIVVAGSVVSAPVPLHRLPVASIYPFQFRGLNC